MGVGTGVDLPLLPPGVIALGIDLSPAMLAKAQQKLAIIGTSVGLAISDAGHLPVGKAAFDTAILNLILSVVPDGNACLRETLRSLKPGGKLIVFDKFVSENRKPTLGRRFINIFCTLLGTDITRRFDQITGDLELNLLHEEASLLKGTYRIILLSKPLIAAES